MAKPIRDFLIEDVGDDININVLPEYRDIVDCAIREVEGVEKVGYITSFIYCTISKLYDTQEVIAELNAEIEKRINASKSTEGLTNE